MILFINTSDFGNLQFVLTNGTVVKQFAKEIAFNENFKTNAFLEIFLKQAKVSPKDLQKIIVCSGPGSFTGIRVGVSLAQALGFALQIPVVAVAKSKIPEDVRKLTKISGGKSLTLNYGQKPNITKSKK
jgi:tRNA threonylcarbamoyladenosine biosynthesis protein TsaB